MYKSTSESIRANFYVFVMFLHLYRRNFWEDRDVFSFFKKFVIPLEMLKKQVKTEIQGKNLITGSSSKP